MERDTVVKTVCFSLKTEGLGDWSGVNLLSPAPRVPKSGWELGTGLEPHLESPNEGWGCGPRVEPHLEFTSEGLGAWSGVKGALSSDLCNTHTLIQQLEKPHLKRRNCQVYTKSYVCGFFCIIL